MKPTFIKLKVINLLDKKGPKTVLFNLDHIKVSGVKKTVIRAADRIYVADIPAAYVKREILLNKAN